MIKDMIMIHNISKSYSKSGWQQYEIKINHEVICTFSHKASEGLAKCLAKASAEVYKTKQKKKEVV